MPDILEGVAVATYGRHYDVELQDGRKAHCVVRGKKGGVACGDQVEIRITGPDQGVIEKVLPRRSLFYRSDLFRTKVIAANVTQVVIVVAPVPSFYEELLTRCLVAAEANGITALIVLNKWDLGEPAQQAWALLQLYRDLGYETIRLSAKEDVSPLRRPLGGHTSILVGQSGMGKSSIINALLPQARAETGAISEALDSGRHTTTYSRLYHLDDDSRIIDSPGMQEFGLHHLDLTEIDHAFVEFRPYLGHCRFSNCRHLAEPGCAVAEAAAAGQIAEKRLAAYRKIAETLTIPR